MARPTKYKQEYNEQAYKLTLLGYTDKDLADFFNVQEETINNWKKRHKQFFKSITQGKDIADANVTEKLYNRSMGYTYKETKIVRKKIVINKDTGEEGEVIETTVTEKHLPADVQAASKWLGNRQRKKWKHDPNKHEEEAQHQHNGDVNIYFKDSEDLPESEDDILDIMEDEE